ncbi:MAG TPA: GntR family transcriptional regulator [Actinomycetes bacterium]|nr:GntR family transcriptional regulator [Actinomycetes bacterium]
MGQRSPEARYQEIERWLRGRVLRSAPGDPLPSELELAARFGVSRMTARQAVQNLAAEGLVQRRRGAGTFVAPRPIHRHEGSLMSFTEDMRRRGMEASSRLLEAGLRAASTADLDALRLPDGARVVAISRLRLADGAPMAIEHAALPAEFAGVLADDLEAGSLHESMIARGRVPAISRSWIRARIASSAESRLLGLRARSALLVERRIIYGTDGLPLEHTETMYNADNYAIDAVFSVARAASLPRSAAPTTNASGASSA